MLNKSIIFAALTVLQICVAWNSTVDAREALPPNKMAYRQLVPLLDDSLREEQVERLATDALHASASGHDSLAENLYKKVVEIAPGNSSARYNLGVLAEKRGKKAEALQWYKQALSLNPSEKNLQSAVHDLTQSIQKCQFQAEKDNARILSETARRAFVQNNFQLAISCLEKLVKTYPQDERIQFALGQSYCGYGDYKRAEQHLRAAKILAPNDVYVADTYQQCKRLKRQAEIAGYQREALAVGRN